jgi:hypothetical protein
MFVITKTLHGKPSYPILFVLNTNVNNARRDTLHYISKIQSPKIMHYY